MVDNLIYNAQVGILKKKFIAPLTSYTQSNCQVTLTNDGYRIYRPPNLTVANNGNTMWGGLVLRFPNPPFIKGHTYIIMFNIKGKTSNSVGDIYWTNNCGWGGGGLEPSPTNVAFNRPGNNWQSNQWSPFYYKWTINDDVYKTCTSSYPSFTQGTVYPSYRDFKFGFGYTSTGEMGTDIYINNLRLYDITDNSKVSILKNGQVKVNEIIETNKNKTLILNGIDIETNEIYEF